MYLVWRQQTQRVRCTNKNENAKRGLRVFENNKPQPVGPSKPLASFSSNFNFFTTIIQVETYKISKKI